MTPLAMVIDISPALQTQIALKGDNQGFNTIDGGAGSDELYSKDGNDTLTGGVGADTFAITIGDRGVDHGMTTSRIFLHHRVTRSRLYGKEKAMQHQALTR